MSGLNKYHTGVHDQKNKKQKESIFVKNPPRSGIFVGYNPIPVDNEVMTMLTDFGINSDYVNKLLG